MIQARSVHSAVSFAAEHDLWRARVFVVNDIGGTTSRTKYFQTQLFALLWAHRKVGKYKRLDKRGLLL